MLRPQRSAVVDISTLTAMVVTLGIVFLAQGAFSIPLEGRPLTRRASRPKQPPGTDTMVEISPSGAIEESEGAQSNKALTRRASKPKRPSGTDTMVKISPSGAMKESRDAQSTKALTRRESKSKLAHTPNRAMTDHAFAEVSAIGVEHGKDTEDEALQQIVGNYTE